MTCRNCGKEISEQEIFCEDCKINMIKIPDVGEKNDTELIQTNKITETQTEHDNKKNNKNIIKKYLDKIKIPKLNKNQKIIILGIVVVIIISMITIIGLFSFNNYKSAPGNIAVYKDKKNNGGNSYSNKKKKGNRLINVVNCKNKNCEYIRAYDKYLVTREGDEIFVYDYKKNKLVFGPVKLIQGIDPIGNNILGYKNTLYGIFYEKDGKYNIHNIKTENTISNINGVPRETIENFDPRIIYKYGYIPIIKNDTTEFINLNTGKVTYSIKFVDKFYEDEKNNIIYIKSYKNLDYDKFVIYDTNGNLLLNGIEFTTINLIDSNLILGNSKNFKIYDSELNLKFTSKDYNNVLYIYNDFILVINNNHLEIVDMNDKVLATFKDEWNSQDYIINFKATGWDTKDDKYGIYITVRDEGSETNYGREYYYIPKTGESGFKEIWYIEKWVWLW